MNDALWEDFDSGIIFPVKWRLELASYITEIEVKYRLKLRWYELLTPAQKNQESLNRK